MRIRRAEPRDLVHIVEIGRESFPYIGSPGRFFTERLGRAHVYVAVLGGEVVGFVDYEAEGSTLHVHGIAVKDGYRGLGIGKKLLWQVIQDARNFRMKRVRLMTLEDNVPARRLYESLGFRPAGKDGRIIWYEKEVEGVRQ